MLANRISDRVAPINGAMARLTATLAAFVVGVVFLTAALCAVWILFDTAALLLRHLWS
jgi:hypothetical protein